MIVVTFIDVNALKGRRRNSGRSAWGSGLGLGPGAWAWGSALGLGPGAWDPAHLPLLRIRAAM